MLDIQTPTYFITPRFQRAGAQVKPVIDPATLEQVGPRAEVSPAEFETAGRRGGAPGS